MQARQIFRHSVGRRSGPLSGCAGLAALLLASGCGSGESPYAGIKDAPLIQGRLHTVTLVSDTPATAAKIRDAGYTPVSLPPNYERANAVEAAVWDVPEAVAAQAQYFQSTRGAPDIRLVVMTLAPRAGQKDSVAETEFFRKVLGVDVPGWPLREPPSDHVRVQAWTYFVPDVVTANRRLRENGIAVTYDPVAITTSYLGDHRMLALRAPDGTVVQLVQSSTQ
jgi:hypothetical protein